jgi:molecular chaperone HscC
VLDLFEGVMEVRASAGDNMLGGEDFMRCLVDHFFEHCKLPSTLKNDHRFMQRLYAQAEAAKRALSDSANATIRIVEKDVEHLLEIDEHALERICDGLLRRLRDPVERALRDANLRTAELDNVVLAGGATRMPMVRRLVARMFGRFPACDINPDEVVALGAAVQAGLKMRDAALDEVVMTDVAPYSLGIAVSMELGDGTFSNGHFDPIIERNTPVPVSRVKRYFAVTERQKQLDLNVFQGEARMCRDNIHLGNLQIALPQLAREDSGIDVRFTYDINGLLQVDATIVKTAQKHSIVIEGNPGMLSEAEIAARFIELSELKIHPRDRLEHRTLLARAERLYQQIRGPQREWFGAQILAFEQALETQDKRRIEPQRKQFEAMLNDAEHHSFTAPINDGIQ